MKHRLLARAVLGLGIFALLLGVFCEDPFTMPDEVSGKVTDRKKYAIQGAEVSYGDKSVEVDEKGKFILKLNGFLQRGEKVKVTKPGYETKEVEIPESGELGTIKLTLISQNDSFTLEAPFELVDIYGPSGWMGDHKDIEKDDNYKENLLEDDPDRKCTKWVYTPKTNDKRWAGAYYQHPDNNWGDVNDTAGNSNVAYPGMNLVKCSKITFWARGDKGGEIVDFKTGGRPDAKVKYNNSFFIDSNNVELTTEWKKFEFDISEKNLSSVLWGFGWSASQNNVNGENLTFYVDEIRCEYKDD